MDVQRGLLEPPPAGQPRSVVDPERLSAILESHRTWLASDGKQGRCADLAGLNLRGADLSSVDLRGAKLAGADLRDSELSSARLRGADLTGADLRNAHVAGTIFRDVMLRDADLSQVRGLLGSQLGGADLVNARLPEAVLRFEGLANAADASKNSQGIFASMLFVCAYAWLTIASTTDAQLLNNAAPASSRLPILGVDIPLVRFYLAAPLLLFCLYIYFHLGLQRLWEELADLPAVFPDGRALDKKAYPWLLNSLINAQFPRLNASRPQLTRWQGRISILLAWGVVPATLLLLWARYLRCHDWLITVEQIVLLSLSLGVGVGLYRLAVATLRGAERRPFAWGRAWKDARTSSLLITSTSALMLSVVTFGSINGVNPELDVRGVRLPEVRGLGVLDLRHWVPEALVALGFVPFANLDNGDISLKPANWRGARTIDQVTHDQEIGLVKGADLGARNLRYSKAFGAFFVNAYLRWSDLQGSDLREADLRGADLRDTVLDRANFNDAFLHKVDLTRARMVGTRMKRAQLQGAELDNADLRNAELIDAVLAPLPLAEPRRSSLREVNLSGADLTGADLSGADLQGANLRLTKLDRADLRGADLTDAVGLTREQLASAKLDHTTLLPARVRAMAAVTPGG